MSAADENVTEGIRILLIRHGETDWNRSGRFQGRSDLPLNEKGREQAQLLALALQKESLAAIYSSPLRRAMEMANSIGRYHPRTPIHEEPGLIEMDLGEFEGLEGKAWAERYPEFRKAWQANPASVVMPGGEGIAEVQTRAMKFFHRLPQDHPPGSTVLLSGHNFVNMGILCHALEMPLTRFRELRQAPAALNILHLTPGGIRVELVNGRSHLDSSG